VIDGQIDYSSFSRDELIDCIRHVDSRRFPKNHANALLELGKRPVPESVAAITATPAVQASAGMRRRPTAVWIIFAYYTLGIAWVGPVVFAVHAGMLQLPPAQQAIFDKFNLLDSIFTAGVLAFNAYAAVSLIRLQRQAFYLFATAFGCNVLATVYAASRGILDQRYVGTVLGLLGAFLTCLYVRSLMNRGVLR